MQVSGVESGAFPLKAVLLFAGAVIITIIAFMHSLGTGGEYSEVFYLLAISLVAVWVVNSSPQPPQGFVSSINDALLKLGIRNLSVSSETAFGIYVYTLLLLVSGLFYTAPRHSRDLGFLTFGMLFSMPFFRSLIYPPSQEIFGLTAFVLSLSLATSLVFSPNPIIAALQTFLLSLLTLVAIAAQPWAIALPFAFILTFPRKKRNAAYLTLVVLGLFLLGRVGFLLEFSPLLPPLRTVFLQALLPLLLLGYILIFKVKQIRMVLRNTKGPTPFLILLLLAYGVGIFLNPELVPYEVLILTVLSVRMVYHLRNIESRRVRERVLRT
ncbi:hypothetical protein A3L09_01580 [Thermococcus profundus]|uniref:Uncharacterized protein n=2 Tax=Thermococcus profundus TaxID=49899 RepID=A0A2Z2M8N6_THEPR|nr:hypothetical protein A3L09_01580 [Thermococcus profundus]